MNFEEEAKYIQEDISKDLPYLISRLRHVYNTALDDVRRADLRFYSKDRIRHKECSLIEYENLENILCQLQKEKQV